MKCLILICVFVFTVPGYTQDSLNIKYLGGYYSANNWYRPGIAISDSLVFLTTDEGLEVLNISNPNAPEKVALLEVDALSITILDSLLNEFTSINISNPLSPRVIKTVELPIMDIRDIFVRGKYAYLGCEGRSDTASFLIIDPDSMKVVSKLDFKFDEDETGIRWIYPEAYGICVTDSFALFATTNFGFWTINITNPKIPIKIGRFWYNTGAQGVVLLDEYVYVVRGWFFL